MLSNNYRIKEWNNIICINHNNTNKCYCGEGFEGSSCTASKFNLLIKYNCISKYYILFFTVNGKNGKMLRGTYNRIKFLIINLLLFYINR